MKFFRQVAAIQDNFRFVDADQFDFGIVECARHLFLRRHRQHDSQFAFEQGDFPHRDDGDEQGAALPGLFDGTQRGRAYFSPDAAGQP